MFCPPESSPDNQSAISVIETPSRKSNERGRLSTGDTQRQGEDMVSPRGLEPLASGLGNRGRCDVADEEREGCDIERPEHAGGHTGEQTPTVLRAGSWSNERRSALIKATAHRIIAL